MGTEALRQGRLLVTARNQAKWIGRRGVEVVPYGVRHTRDVGAFLTKCGLYAWDWPIFWDRPFDPRDDNTCPKCAAAIVGREAHLPEH